METKTNIMIALCALYHTFKTYVFLRYKKISFASFLTQLHLYSNHVHSFGTRGTYLYLKVQFFSTKNKRVSTFSKMTPYCVYFET